MSTLGDDEDAESDICREIEIRQWTNRGPLLVATDALEPDDPDHPYNQALQQGVVPEHFGITQLEDPRYSGMSRNELLKVIRDLERENQQLQMMLG